MKKMILITGLLVVISFSEQQPQFGLGFELAAATDEMIVIVNRQQPQFGLGFELAEYRTGIEVYFPIISATGKFLIEPSVSYSCLSETIDYTDYYEEDYEYKEEYLLISVGAYRLFKKEMVRFYAGASIGKILGTDVLDATIVAPTVGAESFLFDNFSFGGECKYLMLSGSEEDDDYTSVYKIKVLYPKFILRYYF